jgi:hypothetical protein
VCALAATACDAGITQLGFLSRDAGGEPARVDASAPAADSGDPDASAPTPQYLEAESGELSGGFTVESDPAASALRYLAPPSDAHADDAPGSARARYTFELERAGDYVIWGRIRSPDAVTNRFWIQVDGGGWYKWRISVGDIWYWDRFHDDTRYDSALHFPLAAGSHELLIANCVPGAALDRLYITAGTDLPSGNDTTCRPPHSIEIAGECQPSCGLQGGTDCGPTHCEGKQILPAYDCDICCR